MTTTPKIPEDSLQGALREVKEEVGGDLLPEKGHVILSDIKKIEFGKVFDANMFVDTLEYFFTEVDK